MHVFVDATLCCQTRMKIRILLLNKLHTRTKVPRFTSIMQQQQQQYSHCGEDDDDDGNCNGAGTASHNSNNIQLSSVLSWMGLFHHLPPEANTHASEPCLKPDEISLSHTVTVPSRTRISKKRIAATMAVAVSVAAVLTQLILTACQKYSAKDAPVSEPPAGKQSVASIDAVQQKRADVISMLQTINPTCTKLYLHSRNKS
jgi:hypothetical protein